MFRYIYRNLKFTIKDLLKNTAKALISSFGILFLISFLVLYLSLRTSMKDYIGEKLFGKLAINEIVIYPKAGYGKDVYSTIASKRNTIRPSIVKRIRRMKDFSRVYSLIRLNYESKILVELMGRSKKPHAPLYGIEPGFFAGKNRRWRQFRTKAVLPIIAPKLVIKLFNNYAAVRGMPQFTEKQLIGFPGELYIKTSDYYAEEEIKYKFPVKLHSLTSDLEFSGLLVPNDFIVKFARKHSRDSGKYKKGYSYVRLFARVKNIKDLPAITKKLQKMGLKVKSQSDISKKTNRALEIVDSVSLLIGSIILILTVIAIFNSYLIIVHNRSYGFSLKRVIGVSKIRIVFNFLIEAAVIGVIYGLIGFFVGSYLTTYLSLNLSKWIPVLKGLVLVPAGKALLIKAILLSVSVSCLSALIPALFASNMNLFKAVRKMG